MASTAWAKRVHLFTIFPPPSLQPNQSQCSSSTDRKINIIIKTDKYGGDTAWIVRDSQTGISIARSSKKYGANETDSSEVCLKSGGLYDFIVLDETGDGMVRSYSFLTALEFVLNHSYAIASTSLLQPIVLHPWQRLFQGVPGG